MQRNYILQTEILSMKPGVIFNPKTVRRNEGSKFGKQKKGVFPLLFFSSMVKHT